MAKPDVPFNGNEREYYMNFDTLTVPGKLVATRVKVCRVIVQDMDKVMRLDFADDPCINDLVQNIGANTR